MILKGINGISLYGNFFLYTLLLSTAIYNFTTLLQSLFSGNCTVNGQLLPLVTRVNCLPTHSRVTTIFAGIYVRRFHCDYVYVELDTEMYMC